ncbi:MAG TPA: ABC transporter ATP-binding protein [Solirubrobacteraceae bacterium]|jgi:branched-chain amino acid transport system ATP-binding protein|nr:ABC transporter ATP-binding protein [Solirubrobacteraceae bacterium]
MSSETALSIRDLASGYGDLRVLHGISLDIPAGTVELALGRNGVGKTTLLHTISGIIATRDGQVILGERDITSQPAHRRAMAGISLVQEGKQVFRERTVMENVVLGTYARKLDRAERHEVCVSVLGQFPALVGRERERAGALSGGQQQMLAIAQAMAAAPRVLLLDEPSAGLAPAIVSEVFEHVARLREQGMTILLVEQLAEQALAICDHVTVIDEGVIRDSGAPAEFEDSRRLQEAYFGAPV